MCDEIKILKTGFTVLLTVMFLVGGLFSPPHYQVAANDLPIEEGPPLPSGLEEYVPDQIIVKFKDGFLRATTEQLNQTMGTEEVYASPYAGFKVLQIPKGKTVAEMVEAYSELPNVEYAEPNYIDHMTWSPDDTYYSLQWHFSQINLEAAWDLDTSSPNYGGDSSIVVAVIDTGVAYETYDGYVQAPDLASTNFWTNSGETPGNSTDDDGNGYVDDINGWDFVNIDAHPNDDNSHGTHVCGTIAQSTNNTIGVAGIAFNTTIMPLKVWNSAGSGTHAQMADAFHYAADNGAHIINYSGGGSHSTTKQNAVAYARNAGVIIIAAAGNDYQTGNDPEYPGAYDDYVIAVGATSYNQTRSYYSNTGSYLDIAAPGGDTTVDLNSDGYVDGVLQNTFDPYTQNVTDFSYWFFQGTSMATPHVSGVAALILAEHLTWTAAQVRHALLSTANDTGTTGKDDEYGWGLLHASNSVNSTLVTTASYSDAAHTTACDNFTDYATENTTYMYGTGLLPSQNYGLAYYDGGNTRRDTDNVTSGSSGNLSSRHTFVPGTDAYGTWHVIVYDQAHSPPSTYSSNWTYTIGEDTFILQFVLPPTMEAIVEAEGQYYNTAPVFSNFGFDDDEALDDGWYQMDSYNGTWTSLFTNSGNTSWDSDNWPIPGFGDLSEDSHTIYFKASDNASNVEGESGEWSWQFYKDITPPSDPTSVNSTSHTISVWSSDNTVSVNWTDATDNLSGLDGYSILWNTSANTTPSANKTIEDGIGNVTSSELADGNSHYFHIRSKDNAGNWQSTVHLGPFYIDTTAPSDPTSVNSISHTISVWSSDNTVDITWTDATDNLSGLDGYSILWNTSANTTPSANKTIEEGTGNVTSSELADGNSHYFHIRSVDNAGNWQSTVHLGPFFIAANAPFLSDGTVSPTSGYTSANFTYSVNYTDFEDEAPSSITVSIDGGASENMTVKSGQDDDFTNGEIYEYSTTGANLGVGTNHTYQFAASDGTDNATGDIGQHDGPTVSSPPAPPPAGDGGGGGGGGGGAAGVTSVLNSVTEKGRFTEDVTAKSDDRKAELYIPQNTIGLNRVGQLISSILMKVMEKEEAPATPADSEYIGHVYRLGPDGATFDPPIDLTIKYDESKIPEGIAEKNLIVATFDKSTDQWENLKSTVDLENDTVTAKVSHFTAFAILARTSPASFTVADLSITPGEVNLGESISISVLVTNTGTLTGSYEVSLEIDNVVAQTKEITLDGGNSETISFSVIPDTAGEHTVNISGLLGSCRVNT